MQISLKFIFIRYIISINLISNLEFAWFDRSTCKGRIFEEKERERKRA